MKIAIPAGTTSKRIKILIYDSSSTTGAGLTGLVYNSSGLTWYYTKDGDPSATQVTLGTATLGTWASGGFVAVDGTNMPGVYELGIPNAAIAAGDCHMILKGATNMVPVAIEIQTTNLPANTQQISGTNQTARDLGASVLVSSGTGTGQLDITSGVVKANTTQVAGTAQTARDLGASVLLSVGTGTGQVNLSGGKVPSTVAAGDLATDSITAASVKADAVTKIQSGIPAAIWDYLTSAAVTVGSFGKKLATLAVGSDGSVTSGASVTNYVSIPTATVQNSVVASTITVVRGDTLSIGLTGMGDISSRTKFVLTAKVSNDDLDADAIIQIVEGTGLTRFNGSGTVTAGHASLTVTNATTGAATVVLNATETAQLVVRDLVWDAQAILTAGPTTVASGAMSVVADVTRATS